MAFGLIRHDESVSGISRKRAKSFRSLFGGGEKLSELLTGTELQSHPVLQAQCEGKESLENLTTENKA